MGCKKIASFLLVYNKHSRFFVFFCEKESEINELKNIMSVVTFTDALFKFLVEGTPRHD